MVKTLDRDKINEYLVKKLHSFFKSVKHTGVYGKMTGMTVWGGQDF